MGLVTARPACGWLWASVIDSSTWVAGGSDSFVTMETNATGLSANHSWVRAPGILKTHAEDFLSSKTHINTHTYIYIHIFLFSVLRSFVGRECICAKVYLCACVLSWCGLLSTLSPGRWRSCHGRVLSGPARTCTHMYAHAHTSGGQGSACIKRANKPSVHTTNPPQTEQADRKQDGNEMKCGRLGGWR